MSYIKTNSREQGELFPISLDEMIQPDSPVRLFDRFLETLDLAALGFSKSVPSKEDCPYYDPKDLIKLYLYGYFYEIQSSRELARVCLINIEVMWLMNQLKPDFRTISDFRKDNMEAISEVFNEFNRFCLKTDILKQSYISVHGKKLAATNSSDRNSTQSQLDMKVEHLKGHIKKYLEELSSNDLKEDMISEIENELDRCKEYMKSLRTELPHKKI